MELLRKLFGAQGLRSIRNGNAPGSSSAFRCVQVNANSKMCCAAVLDVAGKRFLPDEIPSLPVDGCTADSCECSYELFSDRRRVPRAPGGHAAGQTGSMPIARQR